MPNHVFILGGGVSVADGVPLMATFLDRAEDLMRQSSNTIAVAAFRRVFDALDGSQRVHSKASLDLQNLD